MPPYDLARRKEAPLVNNSELLPIIGNELQRRQVLAGACIGRRSGLTLSVSFDRAKNLNPNKWLTPALSGQLPDLGL